MSYVDCCDMTAFLDGLKAHTVHAIITSPPYAGLPGRAETTILIKNLAVASSRILTSDGTMTLIVGSTSERPLLPFEVAQQIERDTGWEIRLHSIYVWDRTGTLERDGGGGAKINHDYIIHTCRADAEVVPLSESSVIRTQQPGFNYGSGVTTPPDLAAFLVAATTTVDQLVIDPLCGLAEIGVQAIHQRRVFAGCDLDPSCAHIANARLAGVPPA